MGKIDPDVNAVIRADTRDDEEFDVLQGIPTSESLYGNVWTKDYLYTYEYQEMTGTCTYNVNVTMPEPPRTEWASGTRTTRA